MVICEICKVNGNEVRLFDAIYEGRMNTLCERCSIVENIPLIKKPDSSQLKESETLRVSEKMKQLSGIREPEKQETFFKEDKLNELNKNPELELPEKHSLNLIDHFHWAVMKNRRRRGLSQKKLAEALGESEMAIQMIEKSKLPENAEIIIKKLEQLFQVKLRKMRKEESIEEPILLDNQGKEIEIIPEEEMIFIDEMGEEIPISQKTAEDISLEYTQKLNIKEQPLELTGDLDLKKINKEKVTIADLQKAHIRNIKATKIEQLEEQKKIEERQRILEALRERDKIKFVERKKQELYEKQKSEENKIRLIKENRKRLEEIRKEESRDIDKHFGGIELIDKNQEPNNKNQYLDENIKKFDN